MPADEAIVLAGGFGTRLRGIVDDVPKPLAPVAGRPFLAWLLDRLAAGGVSGSLVRLAEKRVYPAIDVDASSTRREDLLFDPKQLQNVWKLRRVLSGLASEGSDAATLELLIDRMRTFPTNEAFLAELGKSQKS